MRSNISYISPEFRDVFFQISTTRAAINSKIPAPAR